MASRMIQSLTT